MVSHLRLAFIKLYRCSSFSFGSAASVSEAVPRVGMSSGGRKLTESPGFQFLLPPGPAVARLMVLSNLPPVSPCALTDPSNGVPQADTTVAVAPAVPMSFKRVRRSIVRFSSDMESTLLTMSRSCLHPGWLPCTPPAERTTRPAAFPIAGLSMVAAGSHSRVRREYHEPSRGDYPDRRVWRSAGRSSRRARPVSMGRLSIPSAGWAPAQDVF